MVGSEEIRIIAGSQIVREKSGSGTGDIDYQTADGRWWQKWDGTVKTGQQVDHIRKVRLNEIRKRRIMNSRGNVLTPKEFSLIPQCVI